VKTTDRIIVVKSTDEGNIDETESGFVLDMIEDIKDPTGTSNDNENKDPVTKEDKGNDVIVPNNNENDEIEGNNTDIEVDNISIDPDDFEMEEEDESIKNMSKVEKLDKLIDRLGYSSMTMQIFHKMRETFGHEECEFCGKLFYNKNDFDNHMRTHTGLCMIYKNVHITFDYLPFEKDSVFHKVLF
jgi:hypothetical protein